MSTYIDIETTNTGAVKWTTLTVWSIGNEPMQRVMDHSLLKIHDALQTLGCKPGKRDFPIAEAK